VLDVNTPRALAALGAATVLLTAAAGTARAQLYVTSDRTVANGNPINESLFGVPVYVGLASNGTEAPGVRVDVVDPASLGVSNFTGGGLGAYSTSVVNVLGGSVGSLGASGNSVVTVSGGSHGGIGTSASGTMILNGGTVTTSGGAIGCYVTGGSLTVNAGVTVNSNFAVSVAGGAATLNGGTFGVAGPPPSVNAYGVNVGTTGSLTVNGGLIRSGVSTNSGTASLIRGGEVRGGLNADLGGVLNVTGGTILGSVISAAANGSPGTSLISVSGGAFSGGDFQLFTAGTARVSGGAFADATFALLGSGSLDFFGAGLALTGIGAGSYTNPNTYYGASNYTGQFFRLTGTLADGTAIDRPVFRADGATGTARINNTVTVPEPGTLALAALPLLGIAAGRARRKPHA
jgi:hypothetical protein